MRQKFVSFNFRPDSLALIETANDILTSYQADGYRLTLRQLYYQLVARGHIENSQRSYKRIGDIVSNARLAGLMDWDMIEDRGREYLLPSHWDSPAQIVNAAARAFRIDKWADQPNHVEVMVEKQALEGVLRPVCETLDIGFTANKGYSSSSTMYEAGKRMQRKYDDGKEIWVLYLGDHDPSGIDMTRDVDERASLFAGVPVNVKRLALNMDQVERLNPPPNPAKDEDARFADYYRKFGPTSWELDAIEPNELASLVYSAVRDLRDDDLWAAAVDREEEMRDDLARFARNYGKNGKNGHGSAATA